MCAQYTCYTLHGYRLSLCYQLFEILHLNFDYYKMKLRNYEFVFLFSSHPSARNFHIFLVFIVATGNYMITPSIFFFGGKAFSDSCTFGLPKNEKYRLLINVNCELNKFVCSFDFNCCRMPVPWRLRNKSNSIEQEKWRQSHNYWNSAGGDDDGAIESVLRSHAVKIVMRGGFGAAGFVSVARPRICIYVV